VGRGREVRSRHLVLRHIGALTLFSIVLSLALVYMVSCGSATPLDFPQIDSPETSDSGQRGQISPTERPTESVVSESDPESEPSVQPVVPSEEVGAEIQEAFESVLLQLQPLPVYAPTALPEGATLADSWRPIIAPVDSKSLIGSSSSPAEEGPPALEAAPNPRLIDGPQEPQAEIMVDTPRGPLLFLENFRGDLGDVSGDDIGTINGHPAVIFGLAGGWLVQWSDEGRWYCVYGSGMSKEDVAGVALEMDLLQLRTDR